MVGVDAVRLGGARLLPLRGREPGAPVGDEEPELPVPVGAPAEDFPVPRRTASKIAQTLEISFSAVSKPNFARKYAMESSRRDIHNALLCTALKSLVLKIY